jgi:phosphopantetheinyl transferase
VQLVGVTERGVESARQSDLPWLSARELEIYRSLPPARQADWLAGRLALKRAYAAASPTRSFDLSRVVVAYRATGQPCIAGDDGAACSLAHSAGWGLGAVAPFPIGVDIERVRPRHAALLGYIAEEREIALVHGQLAEPADPDSLVTTIWAVKEAVMKATGRGLAVPARALTIEASDRRPAGWPVALTVEDRSRVRWQVHAALVGRFALAVALPRDRVEELRDVLFVRWYQPPRLRAPRHPPRTART